jgi:hypothetical protein
MEIAHGRINGMSPENFEKREAFELRCHNANFPSTMADGTVYLAPGSGLVTSGDCWEDKLNCDKIFSELKYWQEVTEKSEAEVRSSLNWLPSQPLRMKIMFDNRRFCIYEATTGTRIAFNVQTSG